MLEGPFVLRMTDKDFEEAKTIPPARGRAGGAATGRGGAQGQQQRLLQFYKEEGVVALFNRGSDADMSAGGSELSWRQQRPDGGTIFPTGSGSRGADAGSGLPTVTLAVEHYNRMVRVLAKNVPVKVALDVQTRFIDETTGGNGFNVIAELPGSDPVLKDEIVMLGAHFDSVAAGTGATDNATGSAAMMEALRILQAVGAKPRRTIRIGLWGGEEQGLLGSRAYVREHFGDAATMALTPAHEKLSAYFNSDNGTGRIRGIWLQSNLAVEPIFRQWMEPLEGSRRDRDRPALGNVDRSRLVRRRRPAGLSVHGRSPRIQLAHAPLEHGHVRSRAGRRHDPAGDSRRGVRLQRRDARCEAATQGEMNQKLSALSCQRTLISP